MREWTHTGSGGELAEDNTFFCESAMPYKYESEVLFLMAEIGAKKRLCILK